MPSFRKGVETSAMLNIEFEVLDFIRQHLRTDFGDVVMPAISALGDRGMIWICLAIILCALPRYRKSGITMLIALILNLIICNITLKPLIARMRPFSVHSDIELLIRAPRDFSFPSGHTASSFSAAFALMSEKKSVFIPSLILASLIAFSRLYLYVHYPSDVLAGILLGLLNGIAAHKIYQHFEKHFKKAN